MFGGVLVAQPDTWARLARGEKRVRTRRDFFGAGQVRAS